MSEIEILQRHGFQTIKRLDRVELTPLFRGRPEIADQWTPTEKEGVRALCPTGAFQTDPVALDLAKCVFCKACALQYPDKVRFTNDFNVATNDPQALIIRAGVSGIAICPDKVRPEIKSIFRRALKLRQVSAGGDNSAEMELNACGNVNFDMGRYGIEFVASPRHADGLVITGPITENMVDALETCYRAIPQPKLVVLAGTDAISGGVFSKNEVINRRFLELYPVDLLIPGNPPHPLSIINGLLNLVRPDWKSGMQ